MQKRSGHLRTLEMQDSIVDGWQILHRDGTQNVTIVTGRSNLLFLRILIEALLSIQRGAWLTVKDGEYSWKTETVKMICGSFSAYV